MAVNLVQYAEANATASLGGGIGGAAGFFPLTVTFTNPVTPGNTILVLGGGNPNGMFPAADSVFSMTDSVSDSFTPILNNGAPRNSGPTVFAYLVPSTAGGASVSVTTTLFIQSAIFNINFPWIAVIIELSGMNTPTVHDKNSFNIFGSAGNSPITESVTDSLSNTVNVTFFGASGSGGPGLACTLSAIDFVTSGLDFLIAFVMDQSGTSLPTADHGYTFQQTVMVDDATVGMNMHLFTPILPFITPVASSPKVQYVKRHMAPGN